MTFTHTIELGNDAMQTGYDLGHAINEVGARILHKRFHTAQTPEDGKVYDANGNTVGRWEVTE